MKPSVGARKTAGHRLTISVVGSHTDGSKTNAFLSGKLCLVNSMEYIPLGTYSWVN